MGGLKPAKVIKYAIAGCGVFIAGCGLFVAALVWSKLSFDSRIGKAREQFEAIGVGFHNGRRSAEGHVFITSHDPTFGTSNLVQVMPLLRNLEKDGWISEISLRLENSGVSDADMVLIQGLVKLKRVDVRSTSVTEKGVQELLKLYPSITVITNGFEY